MFTNLNKRKYKTKTQKQKKQNKITQNKNNTGNTGLLASQFYSVAHCVIPVARRVERHTGHNRG